MNMSAVGALVAFGVAHVVAGIGSQRNWRMLR